MKFLNIVAPVGLTLLVGAFVMTTADTIRAEDNKAEATKEAGADAGAASAKTPLELVNSTEKGKLINPYASDDKAIVEEGKKLYLGNSCNGCHGGTGGGGMCPPLTNETWIYGGDDDTLFRLITLGSAGLKESGYSRVRQEAVKGPMPDYKNIIQDTDELWKIITFVRSTFKGREEKKEWK